MLQHPKMPSSPPLKTVYISLILFVLLLSLPLTIFYLKTADTHTLVKSVDDSLASNSEQVDRLHSDIRKVQADLVSMTKRLRSYEEQEGDPWARGYDKGLRRITKQRFWFQMIRPFEKKVYSQNGEDGVQERIFEVIGTKDKYYVEIGVQEGYECNTAHMRENLGWKGLLIDDTFEDEKINLKKHRVSKENVVELFEQYGVPKKFDYLSVDIDSFDYYVRDAIGKAGYQPRIVAHEVNTMIDPRVWRTMSPENEKHLSYTHFGASLAAMDEVNRKYGYLLLYCDSIGVNCWWIHEDEITNEDAKNFLKSRLVETVYRVMNLGNIGRRHDRNSRHIGGCREDGKERQLKCTLMLPEHPEYWTTDWELSRNYLDRTVKYSKLVYDDILQNW